MRCRLRNWSRLLGCICGYKTAEGTDADDEANEARDSCESETVKLVHCSIRSSLAAASMPLHLGEQTRSGTCLH